MAFRVLITDRAWPDSRVEREILGEVGAEVFESPSGDEATLIEAARDCDAIATCWARVTRAVIDAAPRLQTIARLGIGLDNICVEAATERRIPVTNVPDYCVSEVSDHALALLLAGARKIAFFHHRAKQGEYKLQSGGQLRRLSGRTLGLVGLGHIGRALVPKGRALGLDVIANTKSGDDHGTGCRMVSLEELLRTSDYISLHLPVTDETRGLLGENEFGAMKSGAWLINTSRGALIDHDALWRAIEKGQIAGAGLDVFDPEPPDLSHPLFRDERVIVTPHAAFLSEESLQEMRERAARQLADVLRGARPANVVNPEIYG
ncbi:MAG: C-terminal binding protein [Planctomycetaceae bacterium]